MTKGFNIACFHRCQPWHRRFGVLPPVDCLGYMTDKTKWENRRFDKFCAFSFILNGQGGYKRFGKSWQVVAPCVLTQWAGDIIEYGPDGSWDELYISYPSSCIPLFRDGGYMNEAMPVWEVADRVAFEENRTELMALVGAVGPGQAVDRVDALCMKLITDSLCGVDATKQGDEAVLTVLRAVNASLNDGWCVQNMAEMANMSLSTFKRRWQEAVGGTPKQYIIQKRLEMACHLLHNPSLRVSEVAADLSFGSYFYFARLFKKHLGMTPTAYRQSVLPR